MKTDKLAIDIWTPAHFALGMLLAKWKMKFTYALGFTILWEILEQPVTPESFKYNVLTDIAANCAGFWAGRKIWS